MKTTLHLPPVGGGSFNCLPARAVELDDDRIDASNVTLPWDFNPHNTRLFVIGHEFGAVCAVWADHEQDALDQMIDLGFGDCFLVSPEDQARATDAEREEWTGLGNASEPCDLTYAWIQRVRLDPVQDCQLLCRFAEARGANETTLDR